jgi:pimeloyl-ACP methyl ester carboxylesterase
MTHALNGFVKVPGARLYYEDSGEVDKPALLFIHAGIADSQMWQPQVDFFARDHCVVRYDTRGYGKTTSEDVEFSNRADAIAVLDHLGIDKAVLIGCSRGGQIAIDTALEYPDRVLALVPVCAGLSGYDFQPSDSAKDIATGELFEQMELAESVKDSERLISLEVHLWADGAGQPVGRAPAHVRELMRDMIATAYRSAQPEGRAIPLEPPAAERLPEINVPTLVIAGALDTSAVLQIADFMEQRIAGAQKLIFEGTAHVPSMEFPERFNQALSRFLQAYRL